MIENINPYNETEFKKIFTNTEIYKKLEQDFDGKNLVWKKHFDDERVHVVKSSVRRTPRASFPEHFSATIFYYLLPLLEKNYDAIYDIGCGPNMFKPYLPRLIGIGEEWSRYDRVKDPSWPDVRNEQDFDNLPEWIKHECLHVHGIKIDNPFHGDIKGVFNDDFVLKHQNYFQSVFSICALHFHPLHLFKKIVVDFASIVKVGGRGFLALNLKRMIEIESEQFLLQEFSTATPSNLQYDQYIRKELSSLDLKFLILDVDITLIGNGIDGNIRLVFER
jgi:hypothetical protein